MQQEIKVAKKNKLDAFVTKVPMPQKYPQFGKNNSNQPFDQPDQQDETQNGEQQEAANEGEDGQDLHKQHFFQTLQALQTIKNNIKLVPFEDMQD